MGTGALPPPLPTTAMRTGHAQTQKRCPPSFAPPAPCKGGMQTRGHAQTPPPPVSAREWEGVHPSPFALCAQRWSANRGLCVTFLLKRLPRLVMICVYASYVDLLRLPKTLKAMMTEQR